MANTPEGATLVENAISGAPGFRMENVFVLAGVPSIMQAMFEAALEAIPGGVPLAARTVTAYLPEGTLAGPLKALQADYPDIDMGSYPFYQVGRHGSNLVLRGTDAARLDTAVDELVRNRRRPRRRPGTARGLRAGIRRERWRGRGGRTTLENAPAWRNWQTHGT